MPITCKPPFASPEVPPQFPCLNRIWPLIAPRGVLGYDEYSAFFSRVYMHVYSGVIQRHADILVQSIWVTDSYNTGSVSQEVFLVRLIIIQQGLLLSPTLRDASAQNPQPSFNGPEDLLGYIFPVLWDSVSFAYRPFDCLRVASWASAVPPTLPTVAKEVGFRPEMQDIVDSLLPSQTTVLVLGPSGARKTELAAALGARLAAPVFSAASAVVAACAPDDAALSSSDPADDSDQLITLGGRIKSAKSVGVVPAALSLEALTAAFRSAGATAGYVLDGMPVGPGITGDTVVSAMLAGQRPNIIVELCPSEPLQTKHAAAVASSLAAEASLREAEDEASAAKAAEAAAREEEAKARTAELERRAALIQAAEENGEELPVFPDDLQDYNNEEVDPDLLEEEEAAAAAAAALISSRRREFDLRASVARGLHPERSSLSAVCAGSPNLDAIITSSRRRGTFLKLSVDSESIDDLVDTIVETVNISIAPRAAALADSPDLSFTRHDLYPNPAAEAAEDYQEPDWDGRIAAITGIIGDMLATGAVKLSPFDRHCPVQWCRNHFLAVGSALYSAVYRGRIYFMSSLESLEEFLHDPRFVLRGVGRCKRTVAALYVRRGPILTGAAAEKFRSTLETVAEDCGSRVVSLKEYASHWKALSHQAINSHKAAEGRRLTSLKGVQKALAEAANRGRKEKRQAQADKRNRKKPTRDASVKDDATSVASGFGKSESIPPHITLAEVDPAADELELPSPAELNLGPFRAERYEQLIPLEQSKLDLGLARLEDYWVGAPLVDAVTSYDAELFAWLFSNNLLPRLVYTIDPRDPDAQDTPDATEQDENGEFVEPVDPFQDDPNFPTSAFDINSVEQSTLYFDRVVSALQEASSAFDNAPQPTPSAKVGAVLPWFLCLRQAAANVRAAHYPELDSAEVHPIRQAINTELQQSFQDDLNALLEPSQFLRGAEVKPWFVGTDVVDVDHAELCSKIFSSLEEPFPLKLKSEAVSWAAHAVSDTSLRFPSAPAIPHDGTDDLVFPDSCTVGAFWRPRIGSWCPIALHSGALIRGDEQHSIAYNGSVYQCADERAAELFTANPALYTSPPAAGIEVPPPRLLLVAPLESLASDALRRVREHTGVQELPWSLLQLQDLVPTLPRSAAAEHAAELLAAYHTFLNKQVETAARKKQLVDFLTEQEEEQEVSEEQNELLAWEPEDEDLAADRVAQLVSDVAAAVAKTPAYLKSGFIILPPFPDSEAEFSAFLSVAPQHLIPEAIVYVEGDAEILVRQFSHDRVTRKVAEWETSVAAERRERRNLAQHHEARKVRQWRRRNIGNDSDDEDDDFISDEESEDEAELLEKKEVLIQQVNAELEDDINNRLTSCARIVALAAQSALNVITIKASTERSLGLFLKSSLEDAAVIPLASRITLLESVAPIPSWVVPQLQLDGRLVLSAFGHLDPVSVMSRADPTARVWAPPVVPVVETVQEGGAAVVPVDNTDGADNEDREPSEAPTEPDEEDLAIRAEMDAVIRQRERLAAGKLYVMWRERLYCFDNELNLALFARDPLRYATGPVPPLKSASKPYVAIITVPSTEGLEPSSFASMLTHSVAASLDLPVRILRRGEDLEYVLHEASVVASGGVVACCAPEDASALLDAGIACVANLTISDVAAFERLGVWHAAVKVVASAASARRSFVDLVVRLQSGCPVATRSLLPSALVDQLLNPEYLHYCARSWQVDGLLVDTLVADPTNKFSAIYCGKCYKFSCAEYLDDFLSKPLHIAAPSEPKPLPADLPKVHTGRVSSPACKGLDVVVLKETENNIGPRGTVVPRAVYGLEDFAASYLKKIYLFHSQSNLQTFLQSPQVYCNVEPPNVEYMPLRPPNLILSVPEDVYVQQTRIYDAVANGLLRLGALRPLFPFSQDAGEGARKWLGAYLRAVNPMRNRDASQVERKYHVLRLQAVDECVNLSRDLSQRISNGGKDDDDFLRSVALWDAFKSQLLQPAHVGHIGLPVRELFSSTREPVLSEADRLVEMGCPE